MQNLEEQAVTSGFTLQVPGGVNDDDNDGFCLQYHHMVGLRWKTSGSRDKMGSGRRGHM